MFYYNCIKLSVKIKEIYKSFSVYHYCLIEIKYVLCYIFMRIINKVKLCSINEEIHIFTIHLFVYLLFTVTGFILTIQDLYKEVFT